MWSLHAATLLIESCALGAWRSFYLRHIHPEYLPDGDRGQDATSRYGILPAKHR